MKRIFWLGVGATIGIYVLRKATRTAEALSPSGLAGTLAGLGDAAREFAADVKAAMAEHEHELLTALGVDAHGTDTAADSGSTDSGSTDSGPTDSGPTDSGRR